MVSASSVQNRWTNQGIRGASINRCTVLQARIADARESYVRLKKMIQNGSGFGEGAPYDVYMQLRSERLLCSV